MQRNVQVVDFAELKDIFEQMKVARGAKVLIGEHGAACPMVFGCIQRHDVSGNKTKLSMSLLFWRWQLGQD